MELTFKGVDISTEEKFVSYINSLNTAIMKQNAMNEIKQDLYDVSYLKKRYRKIVARNEKAWTSDAKETHVIKRLVVGIFVIIREKKI